MDWKEVTGDDSILGLVREGREKGEQGSASPSRRRSKIKESITRVSALTARTVGNLVEVGLVAGDV